MAKKDTIRALVDRGIKESIAMSLADANFTVTNLKKATMDKLLPFVSEKNARLILEIMGAPAPTEERADKEKKGEPEPEEEEKPKVEVKEQKGLGIIWSVSEVEDIEAHIKILNDKGKVVWGTLFPMNTSKFKFPMTGYIYIKGDMVHYEVELEEIESKMEAFEHGEKKLIPKQFKS